MYEMPIKKPDIIYTTKLKISFVLGFVANLNEIEYDGQSIWIDLDDKKLYDRHIGQITLNHKHINFSISINDNIIYQAQVNDQHNDINHAFEFDNQLTQHTLKFKSYGFRDEHMPLTSANTSSRTAIKITSIQFDEIEIMPIFKDQSKFNDNNLDYVGNSMFTCNSESLLYFNTPIYRWLLENKKLICY
jgi:hypothetical protein